MTKEEISQKRREKQEIEQVRQEEAVFEHLDQQGWNTSEFSEDQLRIIKETMEGLRNHMRDSLMNIK